MRWRAICTSSAMTAAPFGALGAPDELRPRPEAACRQIGAKIDAVRAALCCHGRFKTLHTHFEHAFPFHWRNPVDATTCVRVP